jgi:hypothetical protein
MDILPDDSFMNKTKSLISDTLLGNPGVHRMADEKKLSVGEVRKTIAVSLAAAFGFVIALLWNEVVKAGLAVAGVNLAAGNLDLVGWIGFTVVAVVITIVMIVLIIVFGRWGNK